MPVLPPELSWIVDGLLAALACGLLLACAVGLLLLASPRRLFAVNAVMSRWVDTSASLRKLERPLQIERFFYRHHRIVGALIVLGAAYVLWRWAFAFERDAFLTLIGRRWVTSGLDWIISALEAIVVLLHVLILAVGSVILLRPSLLKGVEKTANRWHSGPPSERLDAVVATVDEGVAIYPRLSGAVLVAASSWCLATLLPMVFQALSR
jgi:hypothetical protein